MNRQNISDDGILSILRSIQSVGAKSSSLNLERLGLGFGGKYITNSII